MNYWQRWIGAWRKKTSGNTMLERGAYTELLDAYYAGEKPLPEETNKLFRMVGAMTKDEQAAVSSILKEHFELREDGWHNVRADEELERWRAFCEQQRRRRQGSSVSHADPETGELPDTQHPKPKRERERVNGHKIAFDFEKGAFTGIDELQLLAWQDAYPALIIDPEVARAAEWVKANPANRKQNYARFLVNWFTRAQERAPRVS